MGFPKIDLLGLRTLTVLDDALKSIERESGRKIDIDVLPLDDPEVFRLFQEGRTKGVFQFESGGMVDLLRKARPTKFEDLAALNALYRPGALDAGMVDEYVKRKNGTSKPKYLVPAMKEILEETYGVIVYQEQVMQIPQRVAGYTLGQADLLRKAMGKKQAEVMAAERDKFVAGAIANGYDKKKANEIFDYIEPFARYGFNKAHAVAYALIAYRTAWLKVYHSRHFMAALLSNEMDRTEQLESTADSAQRVKDEKERGQNSLFGMLSGGQAPSPVGQGDRRGRLSSTGEWPDEEKLRYEKETLGFYVSGHPLHKYASELKL